MCWFSMFVRLASLRGDALLCSPAAGALASHARILALLVGILAQDCSWIASYCRTLGDGSARWAGVKELVTGRWGLGLGCVDRWLQEQTCRAW